MVEGRGGDLIARCTNITDAKPGGCHAEFGSTAEEAITAVYEAAL